jgi:hypothetical protein
MIQRSQSIICMCALMLVGTRATAQIPPAEDSPQWTTVAAAWRVKPKLAISTFGAVHLGDDVSHFDLELASAGLIYPLSRWVSLGTGYPVERRSVIGGRAPSLWRVLRKS